MTEINELKAQIFDLLRAAEQIEMRKRELLQKLVEAEANEQKEKEPK